MRIILEVKNERGDMRRVERADKRDIRKARRDKAERSRWALNNAFNGSFAA